MKTHNGGRLFYEQAFRRADIGLNHKFLDQLMGVKSVPKRDAADPAVFIYMDATFRQLNRERRAIFAAFFEHRIGGVDILDNVENGFRRVTCAALCSVLGLAIGEAGMAAHHAAMEFMAQLYPRLIKNHAHGHTGAVFIRA